MLRTKKREQNVTHVTSQQMLSESAHESLVFYFPSIMSPAMPHRSFSISISPRWKTTDGKAPASSWWTCSCEWEINSYGLRPLNLGGHLLCTLTLSTPTYTNNITQWLRQRGQQTAWLRITIPPPLFMLLKFSSKNLTFEEANVNV